MTARAPVRAWRAWRAEGVRGLVSRLQARARERARRAAFAASTPRAMRVELGELPLLNVLPFPPAPERGGVAVSLSARLDEELRHRAIVLLYHDGRRWRLEARGGRRRLGWRGPRSAPPVGLPAGDPELAALVASLADDLGTRAVHLETCAGLHPADCAALASSLSLILSTHDFALYCPRVNVLEEPSGAFCDFSSDLDRCARCLARDGPVSAELPARWRSEAQGLIEGAAAMVHPSDFVRRTLTRLFPDTRRRHEVTIAPAVAIAAPGSRRPHWPPRRIAFVGQAERHKGILEFEGLVELGTGREARSWAVAGGGDSEILGRLRVLGVELLGPYLPGTLPSRLHAAEIDLALLLSRFPETHSLALDECLVAQVPVLATPVGALAERVTALGAGWLTPPGTGVDGLSERISSLAADPAAPATLRFAAPPRPADAARAHLELYARLGHLGHSA